MDKNQKSAKEKIDDFMKRDVNVKKITNVLVILAVVGYWLLLLSSFINMIASFATGNVSGGIYQMLLFILFLILTPISIILLIKYQRVLQKNEEPNAMLVVMSTIFLTPIVGVLMVYDGYLKLKASTMNREPVQPNVEEPTIIDQEPIITKPDGVDDTDNQE